MLDSTSWRIEGDGGAARKLGLNPPLRGSSPVETARSGVLVACAVAAAVGLCAWGALGWRHAYRARAEVDHLVRAEEARDAQLLRIVVKGGEAAAQLTLEGSYDPSLPEIPVEGR